MNRSKITKSLFLFCCFFTCLLPVFGQRTETPLRDKLVTINRDKVPLGIIFGDLIAVYDVPLGFEESTLDRNHQDYDFENNLPCLKVCFDETGKLKPDEIRGRITFLVKEKKFTIHAENARLAVVLDQLMAQLSYYKWEITDGVVNIVPTVGRDTKFEAMLNIKIKKFRNVDYRGLVTGGLQNLSVNIYRVPEISNFFEKNGLEYSTQKPHSRYEDRDLGKPIEFDDLTLRELLNKITLLKRGGWALRVNSVIRKEHWIDIYI